MYPIPFIKEYFVSSIPCISVASLSFFVAEAFERKGDTTLHSFSVFAQAKVIGFLLLLLQWWCWNLSRALDTCLIQIKPKPFIQIKLPHFNCLCICNHLTKCLQFFPTLICWMNLKSWFIRSILKRLSALKCRCKSPS